MSEKTITVDGISPDLYERLHTAFALAAPSLPFRACWERRTITCIVTIITQVY